MNINEAFPSAYINAAALNGQKHTVEIERFDRECEMPDGSVKPGVYFKDRRAGLILNRTNATVLESILGQETDSWVGKCIELRTEKVNFQGQMVDGVRVAPATAATAAAQSTKDKTKPAPAFIEEDDDVPF